MTTTKRPAPAPTRAYLESGAKRVFACALDWPGWCRSGRDADTALAALAASAPRYAKVAAAADIPFPHPERWAWDVVERVAGSATTDFGAPGAVPASDRRPLSRSARERLMRLVAASWTVFDGVAATAPPGLRKGPRGGGRDRDDVVRHVAEAELAYARKLGLDLRAEKMSARRAAILAALRVAAAAPDAEAGWPVAYAARRIAWHVLDHVWEIEDRTEPLTSPRWAKTR